MAFHRPSIGAHMVLPIELPRWMWGIMVGWNHRHRSFPIRVTTLQDLGGFMIHAEGVDHLVMTESTIEVMT